MHQRHARINRAGPSADCCSISPLGGSGVVPDAHPGLRCAAPWVKLSEPLRAPERARAPGDGQRRDGFTLRTTPFRGLPHTTGSAGGPDCSQERAALPAAPNSTLGR